MRNMPRFLIIVLLVVMLALALVAAAPSAGWLSLWGPTQSGCSYTITAQWAGVNGAKTLELWLTENNTWNGGDDFRIAPTHFAPVSGKSGTFTYTFPPLATSATMNLFRGWGQLLDAHGHAISGTLDFTGYASGYCTAP